LTAIFIFKLAFNSG